MMLVDTSSWIHFLRPDGDKAARARVETALVAGDACWCPLVRLELWDGAGGSQEKRVLRDLKRHLPVFGIDDEAWQLACDLARKARDKCISVPATDLLIAACARRHGASLEHCDSDLSCLSGCAEVRRRSSRRC